MTSATEAEFATWMGATQARVEQALQRSLPGPQLAPARLHAAMRYAVLGGGKRVRSLLAFAAGEATSADPERVQHAAAAVELIHAYSLVHDDMPAMDDDALRRGNPTVHVEFDEATALLVSETTPARCPTTELLGGRRSPCPKALSPRIKPSVSSTSLR